MKPLIWIIALVVLQGVIAAIAKKAQANAEAARRAKAAGVPAPSQSSSTATGESRRAAVGVRKKPASNAKAVRKAPKPAASRPSATAALQPTPQPTPQPSVRGGDSADALLSRQHLAASVAKIKQVEAKVAAGLPNIEIARPVSLERRLPVVAAADLARALRNPAELRRALVIGEILGKPRCMAPGVAS